MKVTKGSVRRRKIEGNWRYVARITYTDQEGRRRDRMRVARTRYEADASLDLLRTEYRATGQVEIDKRTASFDGISRIYEQLKVHPAEFHQGHKTSGLKSHYQVKLYLEALRGHFGHRRVKEIRHSDLVAYRRQRLKTPTRGEGERSVTSVNRELETLRAVLRFAVRQGYIEKSPFDQGESLIVKQHEKKRERVMSWDEEKRLLEACVDRYDHIRPLIIAAVDLGMRRGELFAVTWADVDLDRDVIVIRPEIEKANRGRAVVMTARAKNELVALKAAALRAKGATAESVAAGRVFGIITNIKNGWKAICKTAKVTDLRFHDLRHTCVTRMTVEAGIPPAHAMRQVGHTTLSMLSRYLNPGEDNARTTATALDELIKSKTPRKRGL